jgi:hypothetical protein
MSHSKKGVRIVTAEGDSWTSQRGARRMIGRGTAERQPDGTLCLVRSDYRILSEPSHEANGPDLTSILREFPIDPHYQDDRAVLKFWPEMAISGVAA